MAPGRFPSTIERELGSTGVLSIGGWLDTFEETPELRWPNDTIVYDRMRKTDAQTASTLRVTTLPVRRTRWTLGDDDVDPRVSRFVEVNLGLTPERKGRRRRRRQGIVWDDLLTHALIMLPAGHMAFEQVYEVGDPGPELEDVADTLPAKVAHLHKLAPRLPRTITAWDVASDGGLEAIHQWVIGADGIARDVKLEIDRLALFVNEREGSDWTGSSVLRSAYKHWLIKDVLIRLGPTIVERNGMGVPEVTYPAGGDRSLALEAATKLRVGEDAGVALPEGYEFKLVGVTGSTKDELPLLKYHDEAIGRNALAMVLDLGHDAGARSLGDTFNAVLANSQNATIDAVCETVTEHIIRDLVALNFGEDEPYPELIGETISPEQAITPEGLKALVDAGVILPDVDLENDIRRRYGLPERDPDAEPVAVETVDPLEPTVEDPNMPTGPTPAPGPPAGPAAMPTAASAARSRAQLEARAEAVRARLERRRLALAR